MKKIAILFLFFGGGLIWGSDSQAKSFNPMGGARQVVSRLFTHGRPVLQSPNAKSQAHYVQKWDPYHTTSSSMGQVNNPGLSQVLRQQAQRESYNHAAYRGRYYPSPSGNYHVPLR